MTRHARLTAEADALDDQCVALIAESVRVGRLASERRMQAAQALRESLGGFCGPCGHGGSGRVLVGAGEAPGAVSEGGGGWPT